MIETFADTGDGKGSQCATITTAKFTMKPGVDIIIGSGDVMVRLHALHENKEG